MTTSEWWTLGIDGEGVLDQVRTGCAAVTSSARFVRIDEDRIAPFAASLRLDGLPDPVWDREHHFLGAPAETAAFVLALDSINFGSGWWPVLRKRPGHSGYLTIATSLSDRFRAHGPWSAAELSRLSAAGCAAVFGQDATGPAADLMTLYARALNDLGAFLLAGWDGDPLGPFWKADGSAERLVGLLLRMPLFRDAGDHDGRPVPILKRAQILAADATLAFAATDVPDSTGVPGAINKPSAGAPRRGAPPPFTDLDRLTIFADNLVPHVLRLERVLRYDANLLAQIDRGDPIPAGAPEETEIRAVALHAAELLVAELCRRGTPTTAARLDYALWHRGQDPASKAHPRHRTRTTAY
jgi:hypothetical protein